jgi:hypothetical protein
MISEPIVSAAFVDFLAHWLDGDGYGTQSWPDQRLEHLRSNWHLRASAGTRLQRMQLDERMSSVCDRLQSLQQQLAEGRLQQLREILASYKFICIVGAPRSGGSYLTSELFSALGRNPYETPSLIAHDGFPDFRPFTFQHGNTYRLSICQAAEFAIALGLFYEAGSAVKENALVVPKKLTKAAYAGEFVKEFFGDDATYVVTVRNPLSACVSTFEKSGGLPEDESFIARSAIEKWIQRDLMEYGFQGGGNLNYFEAYFKYWELYHIRLAMSGLLQTRNSSVLAYSGANMERVAREWHAVHGGGGQPGEFYEAPRSDARYPHWRDAAAQSIENVAHAWRALGIQLPAAELLEFL